MEDKMAAGAFGVRYELWVSPTSFTAIIGSISCAIISRSVER